MSTPTTTRSALGDFLLIRAEGVSSTSVVEALRAHRGSAADAPAVTVRQVGPEITVVYAGGVVLHDEPDGGGVGIFQLAPGEGATRVAPQELLARAARGLGAGATSVATGLAGSFCYAAWSRDPVRVAATADAFRSQPLYYVSTTRGFACATDLRWLLASGLVGKDVDPHALYHYLNFGYVPTPFSILKGARKVPPGCVALSTANGVRIAPYWKPTYPEDLQGDDEGHAEELRRRIVGTVARYRPDESEPWGTFLSGGTDSSSIAGILARQGPVKTFSIGFGEAGYDELAYARVAATRFGLAAHERTVSVDDALRLIPRLAFGFDEPFGNASAIPTHCCAALAAENGVRLLLGGDGGDEIFGGNERYRKDRVFDLYHRAPRVLRTLAEATLGVAGGVDWRPVNRIRNFIRRGSLPNPERFYTDDAFASECFEELLSPELRAEVDRGESLDLLRQTFDAAPAKSELNRLLYMDLQHAIADCDLVKVGRASKMAGVAVSYPYLDPDLVAFTGRLPAQGKVRGFEKRYLFKKAMAGVLPPEILAKRKQGFGLPVSVWLREHPGFRELVHDVVFSPRAQSRGYFDMPHVRTRLERHEKGAWDHSGEIFLLLMLELWHTAHVDG